MDSIVAFEKRFIHLKAGLLEHEQSEVKKFEQKFLRLKKEYEPVQELTLARKLKSTRSDAPDFNIFKILGVQHLEDNTHSPFLAELLNPAGSHGKKGAMQPRTIDLQN